MFVLVPSALQPDPHQRESLAAIHADSVDVNVFFDVDVVSLLHHSPP